jgi:PqqD family protein of HPr-rel-A system
MSVSTNNHQRYQADAPAGLRIITLDVLTAIFQRRSGTTHVVADPVPQIVDILGAKALTVDGLLSALRAAHDLEDDGHLHAALAARLIELEAAGLVYRV